MRHPRRALRRSEEMEGRQQSGVALFVSCFRRGHVSRQGRRQWFSRIIASVGWLRSVCITVPGATFTLRLMRRTRIPRPQRCSGLACWRRNDRVVFLGRKNYHQVPCVERFSNMSEVRLRCFWPPVNPRPRRESWHGCNGPSREDNRGTPKYARQMKRLKTAIAAACG